MLSRLHRAILQKRVELYETGVFKSFALGGFTVSVGNLTVGGTGKTPLVAVCAAILAASGEKVCIISRGYKRANPKKSVLVSDGWQILTDARQAGDEPFELAGKLLGQAIVIADADRVAAANWARAEFGATAFVLDDAFQHLRARRDADIAVIDAANPFGNHRLLPFGVLREPLESLNRADAVVITRANLSKNVEDLKVEIRKYSFDCPIFITENKTANLIELRDFHTDLLKPEKSPNQPVKYLSNKYLAFCGLGNPNNFFEQLRGEKFDLAATETFRDHYFYRQTDAARIEQKARAAGADTLLTTAKDAVKLKNLRFSMPCLVVESEMAFAEANEFSNWLIEKLHESKTKKSL